MKVLPGGAAPPGWEKVWGPFDPAETFRVPAWYDDCNVPVRALVTRVTDIRMDMRPNVRMNEDATRNAMQIAPLADGLDLFGNGVVRWVK